MPIMSLVSGEKTNFQFILRLLNTNVDGSKSLPIRFFFLPRALAGAWITMIFGNFAPRSRQRWNSIPLMEEG